MTYYERTDVSEGIDVNKTNESKECDVCHYWHFLGKGFNFQKLACNGCRDLLMVSTDLDDIPILNINKVNYWYIVSLFIKEMGACATIAHANL